MKQNYILSVRFTKIIDKFANSLANPQTLILIFLFFLKVLFLFLIGNFKSFYTDFIVLKKR
jgi:hypothetical protein